jgi:DNA-binding transcriptional ArsR family regulator
MSESTQTVVAEAPVRTKLVTNLDPATVFAALGYWMRWETLLLLADGREMSISDVARHFDRNIDATSKQLRVMREAGVVACYCPNHDGRMTVYYIPKVFRAEPGMLDFGVCRVPLPTR